MDIYSCRFSPDGKQVITASWDQSIRIWDIDEHVAFNSNSGQYTLCHAEFSFDGQLMAAVYNDNTIRLYDTTAYILRGLLIGHTDYPQMLHFDADGKRLVTTSSDKTVRIWNVEENTLLHCFELEEKASEARFSPNGDFLAISNWEHIFVYKTRDWSLLCDIEVTGNLGSRYISFSLDGDRFVTRHKQVLCSNLSMYIRELLEMSVMILLVNIFISQIVMPYVG